MHAILYICRAGHVRRPIAKRAMGHAAAAAPLRLAYSTRAGWPSAAGAHIAVLDSSFNPPSRAHLALATLTNGGREFDAHLLIYSVRNADKGLGSGASLAARTDMMTCFAKDIEVTLRARSPSYEPNVAVALVDEPLVFAKSTLVHAFLGNAPHLYWVAGSDTITRVFQQKYYPSLDALKASSERFFGQEGSSMVCVDRPAQGTHDDALDELFRTNEVARAWLDARKIELRTIDPDTVRFSSTAVRTAIASGDTQSATRMLSPAVASYLATHPLYT